MRKILAIDVGLKRIGAAFCAGEVVVPLPAVLRKNRNQAAFEVSKLALEYGAQTLVVGMPLGGSSEEEMRRRIEHFVSLLDFSGEVAYQDEAYSSAEASQLHTSAKRDGRLDSIAATVILKRYLGIT